jgi:protein-S-isoprenylcysteine O-methyltransferase Ste14
MNTERELAGHQHRMHEGRKDLAGEHRLGDAIQMILLFLFLVVWSVDSFILHFSTFLAEGIPAYIRWPAGIVVLVPAYMIARAGLAQIFKEERDPPHVVTGGVYALVRHPIYLGAILLYLGFILFSFSLISAALWIAIIIFYRFISRYEEKLLINLFGDEYRDYMKRVPMLFPIRLNSNK